MACTTGGCIPQGNKEIKNLKSFSTAAERFEGAHVLCPGCAHSIIVREILNATNDNMVLSSSTGCLEVCTAIYPHTSWDSSWIHIGFENGSTAVAGAERAASRPEQVARRRPGHASGFRARRLAGRHRLVGARRRARPQGNKTICTSRTAHAPAAARKAKRAAEASAFFIAFFTSVFAFAPPKEAPTEPRLPERSRSSPSLPSAPNEGAHEQFFQIPHLTSQIPHQYSITAIVAVPLTPLSTSVAVMVALPL